MRTVSIRVAKAQLSTLIERALAGDPFLIAKAGKPLVKVTRLRESTTGKTTRLGFMAGQISVPHDFDSMSRQSVEQLFDTDSK